MRLGDSPKPRANAGSLQGVKAGRLLDVKSGQIVRDQAIVIENDKIVSVGAAKDANTTGATIVDLSQATVLPGMIDAHTHLTGNPTDFGYEDCESPLRAKP